jgi:carbonic anhydrase
MFEVIHRYDPDHPPEYQPPRDPGEARLLLEAGNRAFASIADGPAAGSRIVYVGPEDVGLAEACGVPAHQPFAVVIGCSDARVPTELVFDRACNELFVVRVAGNIITRELLGSVDYAVEHLGESLKLIVVLGHSRCGAVTAAVDAYLEPGGYLHLGFATSHNVRFIVNVLFPAVRGASRALSAGRGEGLAKLPGYRAALIECSVILNAAMTASMIGSEVRNSAKGIRVVFGVYDLATRRVHVPLTTTERDETSARLLDAPEEHEEFSRFALRVANSAHINRLLLNR